MDHGSVPVLQDPPSALLMEQEGDGDGDRATEAVQRPKRPFKITFDPIMVMDERSSEPGDADVDQICEAAPPSEVCGAGGGGLPLVRGLYGPAGWYEAKGMKSVVVYAWRCAAGGGSGDVGADRWAVQGGLLRGDEEDHGPTHWRQK